ncbi:MAG: cytochrome c peroxidase [Pseudomonadota bacterium]
MRPIAYIFIAYLVAPHAVAQNLPRPITDEDYAPVDLQEARLGQLLFYDPILSGNKNISCATCHHPRFATGDGVSLSLGEGGVGLGPERKADPQNTPEERIPRHATALFNLGAKEFTVMFHDGRIEVDPTRPGGLRTPMDEDMTNGFASLLSAQTMFPVLSQDEMAGHYSENDVSKAVRTGRITGPGGAWDIIAKRVEGVEEYHNQFRAVYPDIKAGKRLAFTDISNAVAAFIEWEWRSDTSAFDAYLRGGQLAPDAAQGLRLFYGEAGCSTCHSGPFQTDHGFHATGQPQFGPGKSARFESHARDVGRMRVTGNPDDAYAFRTPSLRNVTKTAPYGHTGAYSDLESFIKAHSNPAAALDEYDRTKPVLPALEDNPWWVMDRPDEVLAIRASITMPAQKLSQGDIEKLIAFLGTLEDPQAIEGRLGIPETVPSGLPIDR